GSQCIWVSRWCAMAIALVEKLTPIAIAHHLDTQMHCEPLVIREAAQETGLGAGLNHLQFVVTHILSFEALDFLVDAVSHFLRRVAGEWNSVKSEEVRVLV